MGRHQRLGVTIGTVFGLVFVLVNAGELPAPWPLVLRVAGVAAFAGVALALRAAAGRPATERPDSVRYGRGYGVVVAVEVAALVAGLLVLGRVLDAPEAGVAWISVVVGLHFTALAVLWREASLHVLGAAMAVCGAVGLLLAAVDAGQGAVAAVGGVVPGFLLLGGGAWAAIGSGRVQQHV